ncbi:hypothetical protein Ahy_A03g012468 [Arachis hypogaea]|uniref:Uncharacterized protein n=1 Tax=Arachis hypogaea TaxID=3818 RepID=A0A445DTG4_ARAHY|nr:hypothetical protein Ahy_A03g012468 [Arachis hypogaea]
MADVRYKKFRVLDPYHKKCPSPKGMKLNTFVSYVISKMRVFAGGYDSAVYAEVDHFIVEYTLLILFNEMNQLRDRVIQKS